MKLSFRIKFFVVLLAFSLGPLLVSRGIVGGAADEVAEQISKKTRSELLQIVSTELELSAVSLISLLDAKGESIALGVRMLSQQAELLLGKEDAKTHIKPYFDSDFSSFGDAPPDLQESDKYLRHSRGMMARPIKISLEHPAFRFPADQSRETFEKQIQQLMPLLSTFMELNYVLDESANWFNVGLESGLLVTYPGHGSYPLHYDHREQEWYRRAKQSQGNGVVWTSPEIDPATRRAISIGSYPLRDADGKFLGAVSVDVPVSEMIGTQELKSRWSGDIKGFMVVRYPGDIVTHDGLLIVAQESYDKGGRRHWMSGIEPEWMQSDDPEGFKRLLVAMKESESGYMRLPYKGKDSVWAYASVSGFSFLLLAPEDVISRLPNQMAGAVTSLIDEMRNISAIISGVMLIIVGLIAWFGSRAITKPLLAMADAAQRLARGDFSVHMDMRTGDERDALIDSFNDMVPKLKERLSMRRDMKLAHQVQQLLLPNKHPQLRGYDLSGGISFCEQTGGDYYDFIEVKGEKCSGLGVVLGDVSGHGVASALLMATARGQLHSLSQAPLCPKERIRAINDVVSRDMDGTGRFLTLFYLRLAEDDSTVRWVRAGHDPAFRYDPATDAFSELAGEGIPIGVIEGFEYEDYETTLSSGEVVLIATDGVWEARNLEGEMFGKERVLAIIRQNAHKSADGIRVALMDAVEAFQGNGQEDDIAVVVIKKD